MDKINVVHANLNCFISILKPFFRIRFEVQPYFKFFFFRLIILKMSKLVGSWEFVNSENFEEFLKAIGLYFVFLHIYKLQSKNIISF